VPSKRRVQLAAVYLGTAALVFAAWPVRNLVRFGEAHVAATTWRASDGTPLRDGPVQWARTWADSAPGDSFWELYFVYKGPIQIDRPGVVTPKLYDDEAERKRLVEIFTHYNKEGLSPSVNDEFLALARERFTKHPLRTLFVLPARRIFHLFQGEPEYEMPMRVPWLGLPTLRPLFGIIDACVFVLAALSGLAWRSDQRRWLLLLAVPLLLRCALYGFAIPQATTQRYLVEAYPLIALLALMGGLALADRVRTRFARP
jgi:hypothetical protein